MAGRGSAAPKDPGQRRRYNQPARGEWVDLKPLEKPILPPFRRTMTVPGFMWTAWRSSPVTSQYGPEDVAAILLLAREWRRLTPGEQRLRMDNLGLTPKGKRDLRWRTPAEVQTLAEQPTAAEIRKLRVVDAVKEETG